METIEIKLPVEYRETLDFLKEIIGWKNGEPIQDDTELIEILIAGFTSMIEEDLETSSGHVHGPDCHHD